MKKLSTIELHKENMKFSAGHFTIFSATEREHLHGHNYNVYVALTTIVEENGLSFDYRIYKEKLYKLCREFNQTMLMPANSKYLDIVEEGDYVYVHFNDEKIPFLKRDVTLIPVTNITVEELSALFIQRLTTDKAELESHAIQAITVKIYSAPGQSGSAAWSKHNG